MTALGKFLEQIILKKVEGSVYLLPAITDVQIDQALKDEQTKLDDAYKCGYADGISHIKPIM